MLVQLTGHSDIVLLLLLLWWWWSGPELGSMSLPLRLPSSSLLFTPGTTGSVWRRPVLPLPAGDTLGPPPGPGLVVVVVDAGGHQSPVASQDSEGNPGQGGHLLVSRFSRRCCPVSSCWSAETRWPDLAPAAAAAVAVAPAAVAPGTDSEKSLGCWEWGE